MLFFSKYFTQISLKGGDFWKFSRTFKRVFIVVIILHIAIVSTKASSEKPI